MRCECSEVIGSADFMDESVANENGLGVRGGRRIGECMNAVRQHEEKAVRCGCRIYHDLLEPVEKLNENR